MRTVVIRRLSLVVGIYFTLLCLVSALSNTLFLVPHASPIYVRVLELLCACMIMSFSVVPYGRPESSSSIRRFYLCRSISHGFFLCLLFAVWMEAPVRSLLFEGLMLVPWIFWMLFCYLPMDYDSDIAPEENKAEVVVDIPDQQVYTVRKQIHQPIGNFEVK